MLTIVESCLVWGGSFFDKYSKSNMNGRGQLFGFSSTSAMEHLSKRLHIVVYIVLYPATHTLQPEVVYFAVVDVMGDGANLKQRPGHSKMAIYIRNEAG